jgi:CubicO group peptidase (beta-lactamase class C family)
MESIESFVTQQLAAWEVPGCAVAAVRGGQVELAAGWGQWDREAGLPVTEGTLFAIGSTTKAFTVSAIGALVDDGLLEWDRPLRDYVPDIRLHDPVVTDRLTVIDLLSHRSGLPRHDLTWVGHPDRTRAELVHRLRFLPLSRDLRQEFQYCNHGYMVAGHVVGILAGLPWEDFTRDRLLSPLGMDRSNFSVDEMLADTDHATGYARREGVVAPVPQRPMSAMAPAGAINSCAAEMARWLLAQAGDGQAGGKAVISPATLARQHAPHIVAELGGNFPALSQYAYGPGWAIGRYRDHRMVMHSSGIDGFHAHCMLLPDDGIGVAVMANSSSSMMHLVLACRVLDELLGMEPVDLFSVLKPRLDAAVTGIREARAARRVVSGATLPRPLSAYAGEYEHPGYGTVTITLDGDTLTPSFGTMALSLAHRHYETFDLEWHELGDQPHVFPLMFLSDPDGDITALTVPFEPSLEPLRFDRCPDTPGPDVLCRLCGIYAMGPVEIVVALDGTGAVTRLVAQPIGIFQPKTAGEPAESGVKP